MEFERFINNSYRKWKGNYCLLKYAFNFEFGKTRLHFSKNTS